MNILYNRADPFWVILEFQLAWVYDFCLWPKKWEIQNFFEIGPHLHTAPGVFLNRAPQNTLILIELVQLVQDMQCWYSYLMLLREEDIYDLESCIRITLNFFFFVICYLNEKLYHFSMCSQVKSRSVSENDVRQQ